MSLDTPENQTVEVVQSEKGGVITVEQEFIAYLRSNGYPINGVSTPKVVRSESDGEKDYFVCKVGTHKYPKDHPELDLVAHGVEIPVCTCWSWRSNSADLEEEQPTECGGCKHVQEVYREEKAKADDNQVQLV
jgi:hypothetical protein